MIGARASAASDGVASHLTVVLRRYLPPQPGRNAMLSLLRLTAFGLLLVLTTRRNGLSRFARGVDSVRAPA